MSEATDLWLSVDGLIRAIIAGLAGVGVGCTSHAFGASTDIGVITGAVGTGVIIAVLASRSRSTGLTETASGVPAISPPGQHDSSSEATILPEDLEREIRAFIDGLPTPVKVNRPLQLKRLLHQDDVEPFEEHQT